MKYFLVVDCCSDYKEVLDLKGLIELLTESLVSDATTNNEKDIVSSNMGTMKKIIELQSNTNNYYKLVDYVKEELKGYSYVVKDLKKIKEDLQVFKDFKKFNKDSQESIYLEQVIKMVEEEIK